MVSPPAVTGTFAPRTNPIAPPAASGSSATVSCARRASTSCVSLGAKFCCRKNTGRTHHGSERAYATPVSKPATIAVSASPSCEASGVSPPRSNESSTTPAARSSTSNCARGPTAGHGTERRLVGVSIVVAGQSQAIGASAPRRRTSTETRSSSAPPSSATSTPRGYQLGRAVRPADAGRAVSAVRPASRSSRSRRLEQLISRLRNGTIAFRSDASAGPGF